MEALFDSLVPPFAEFSAVSGFWPVARERVTVTLEAIASSFDRPSAFGGRVMSGMPRAERSSKSLRTAVTGSETSAACETRTVGVDEHAASAALV